MHLVQKYHDSGKFKNTIEYIINSHYNESFDFYKSFSDYWVKYKYYNVAHSMKGLYSILLDFSKANFIDYNKIKQYLKFDYLLNYFKPLPSFLENDTLERKKQKIFNLLKDEHFRDKYLEGYKTFSPKKLYKNIHLEKFEFDVENPEVKERTLLLFIKEKSDDIYENYVYKKIRSI